MRRSVFMGLSSFLMAWIAGETVVYAQNDTGAIDLVGRNGQFVVKDRNGSVQQIDGRDLELNRLVSPPPSRTPEVPVTRPADDIEQKGAEDNPAPTKANDHGGAEDAAEKAKAAQEAAKKAAIRAEDVEMIRKLYNQGGAYFYTKENRPISNEEIVRRMETGDVAEIKVIGLHLQELETKTEPNDDSKATKEVTKSSAAVKPESPPERSSYRSP
ncbi:MAG: hypothetical protein AMXMBFR4_29870 [Candidatus Hydrogenedentota bacterium]